MANTSKGVLFLPPSDAYVRSFLYLLYFNKTLLHKAKIVHSLLNSTFLSRSNHPSPVHKVSSWIIFCGEPVRHSAHDKGHEEGGSAYAKAGSSLRSPPGYSRAFPPQKNQSLPTLLLCALTSDFTGGCPLPPSLSLCQRVNLQLQLIKFLGN